METNEKKAAPNPKRRQREAKNSCNTPVSGQNLSRVLQLQREKIKTARRQISKEQRDAEKQHHFELKQQKRKAKHRGH